MSSSKEVAALKIQSTDSIVRMQESSGRLVELQNELALKDEQIAQLSQDITSLALETEQQMITIQEQDRSLNCLLCICTTND